jgi:hypothetical protein
VHPRPGRRAHPPVTGSQADGGATDRRENSPLRPAEPPSRVRFCRRSLGHDGT